MATAVGGAGSVALPSAVMPGAATTPRPTTLLGRTGRWIVIGGFAFYVLAPLYAGIKFALQSNTGQFSFHPVEAIVSEPGFTDAFWYSARLALGTVIITLVLFVPTTIFVHLRVPRLKPVMEVVTLLPIVFPPIVLILGFLHTAPVWLIIWPYHLALLYAILSLPFVYRALDAGLSALDLETLVEASRSLGARMWTILFRVLLPNLTTAMVASVVLVVALVFSEYTMASFQPTATLPVWIAQFALQDGHVTVAASMLLLVGSWVLLGAVVLLDLARIRLVRRRGLRA